MGYELFDRRGRCVGHYTNNTGAVQIDKAVRKGRKRWPLFWAFLHKGWTEITPELLAEIEDFASRDTELRGIAEDLLKVMRRRKFISIGI
jgi:hypothetical protein